MAESKEYIIFPENNGSINISEEVIAVIAATTAKETDGIAGLYTSAARDLADVFSKKSASKGVRVRLGEDGSINVDIYVTVKVGASVSDAAHNVQSRVASQIEAAVGVSVASVNVHVCSVEL